MNIKETIINYIQDKIALNAKNWNDSAAGLALVDRLTKYANHPLLKKTALKMAKLSDPARHHTQSWIVPLDHELRFERDLHNIILPIDLVRKAITESSYRVIMHKCICRTGQKCTHYPIDFGCIFLGEASQVMVKRGVAREASIDEALAHLERAAAMGLICQCLWIEAERFPLGLRKQDHHKFMEICLCCPCCCLGFRNFAHMPAEFTGRFQSIGWIASEASDCLMCGECIDVCPVNARSMDSDKVSVSAACFGCGLCAVKCPEKCIVMKPKGESKERIQDYFKGLHLDV